MDNPGPAAAPNTGGTDTRLTACPRCGTSLRLLRPPNDLTPVKCFRCQAVFSLEPIETVPVDVAAPNAAALGPLKVTAPLPGSKNAVSEPALRPLTLSPAPPASPLPPMTFSVPPPPPLSTPPAPIPAAVPNERPSPAPSLATPAAAPASLAPHSTAAPGLPVPNAIPAKRIQLLDLGPSESIIAIVVTVVLIAALGAGGYFGYRAIWPAAPDGQAEASGGDSRQPAATGDGESAANLPAEPSTLPALPDVPPDAEARTAELIGYWVSRADDGGVSVFDLQADEVAYYQSAGQELIPNRRAKGRWAVTSVDGPLVTIDIIYASAGLEVHRVQLEIVGPECFLVRQTSFRGRIERMEQRYVRRTVPPA